MIINVACVRAVRAEIRVVSHFTVYYFTRSSELSSPPLAAKSEPFFRIFFTSTVIKAVEFLL